jgi:hypothetical protein
MDKTKFLYILFVFFLPGACQSVKERTETAEAMAVSYEFQKSIIKTDDFRLLTYQRNREESESATLYIEGDGFAFAERNRVSPNPTPKNSMGLKLAIQDKSPRVFYIARPCQFVPLKHEPLCSPEYWTTKRYAPEIVEAINSAIDQLVKKEHINKIRLVGYSGGGTIAALIAARRSDVQDLRTIAGNLDIRAFVLEHDVTPLNGSLNPITFAKSLASVPQRHFIGSDDKIVTPNITKSYVTALRQFDSKISCVEIRNIEKASHAKGWEDVWRDMHQELVVCRK